MNKYKGFFITILPILICLIYVLFGYTGQSKTNDLQLEIDKALASQELFRNLDTTLYADYVVNRIQRNTKLNAELIENTSLRISSNRDTWIDQLDMGVAAFNNYYNIEGTDIKAKVDGDMVSVTLQVNEEGVVEFFPLVFLKKN